MKISTHPGWIHIGPRWKSLLVSDEFDNELVIRLIQAALRQPIPQYLCDVERFCNFSGKAIKIGVSLKVRENSARLMVARLTHDGLTTRNIMFGVRRDDTLFKSILDDVGVSHLDEFELRAVGDNDTMFQVKSMLELNFLM